MLPRQELGGGHQHSLPTRRHAASIAYTATTVLPAPTSACNNRCIACGCARSRAISCNRAVLPGGELEREQFANPQVDVRGNRNHRSDRRFPPHPSTERDADLEFRAGRRTPAARGPPRNSSSDAGRCRFLTRRRDGRKFERVAKLGGADREPDRRDPRRSCGRSAASRASTSLRSGGTSAAPLRPRRPNLPPATEVGGAKTPSVPRGERIFRDERHIPGRMRRSTHS